MRSDARVITDAFFCNNKLKLAYDTWR